MIREGIAMHLQANSRGLDFSPLAASMPEIRKEVESRALAEVQKGAGAPKHIAGVAPGTLSMAKAFHDRVMANPSIPDTEEGLQQHLAKRKLNPLGTPRTKKKPATEKDHHEDLLAEDQGVQEANKKKPKSPEEIEHEKLMVQLKIMNTCEDEEFHRELDRKGVLKHLSKDALEKASLEQLHQKYKLMNTALGMGDNTESYLGGLQYGAEMIEKLSFIGFKKLGLTPLDGLGKSVKENDRIRKLVKRYALENDGFSYTSAGQALMWEIPTLIYKQYQANMQAIQIKQKMAVIPKALVDEYKDL